MISKGIQRVLHFILFASLLTILTSCGDAVHVSDPDPLQDNHHEDPGRDNRDDRGPGSPEKVGVVKAVVANSKGLS